MLLNKYPTHGLDQLVMVLHLPISRRVCKGGRLTGGGQMVMGNRTATSFRACSPESFTEALVPGPLQSPLARAGPLAEPLGPPRNPSLGGRSEEDCGGSAPCRLGGVGDAASSAWAWGGGGGRELSCWEEARVLGWGPAAASEAGWLGVGMCFAYIKQASRV